MLQGIHRLFGAPLTPEEAVRQILREIRSEGDAALQRWSAALDGLDTLDFRVSMAEIRMAKNGITEEERQALWLSAESIRRFYSQQPIASWSFQEGKGSLGQLVRPINRVGIYVPGGTAPAFIRIDDRCPCPGCRRQRNRFSHSPERGTGKIAPITLAAADLLGTEEIYTLGGAQAIGALAYGSQSIRPVDKIFGPGNLFVTLAKRQVFGTVGIDGLAGPTETMVIADDTANPKWVAADLLAQAEHDILASAILLTSSRSLAETVQAVVDQQVETLPRAEVIRQSLGANSGIVLTENLAESIRLANDFAPEHLCLSIAKPNESVEKIIATGGIFVGEYSCEVLGDYVAGPSHVMPTSGTARFASPVNVLDFVHLVSYVALDDKVASSLSHEAAIIARSEGLEAHARAADARRK